MNFSFQDVIAYKYTRLSSLPATGVSEEQIKHDESNNIVFYNQIQLDLYPVCKITEPNSKEVYEGKKRSTNSDNSTMLKMFLLFLNTELEQQI